MKRTVWHHKEVFQSPPRGVFRSRFLWDSLVVFTLRCSLTILRASCMHSGWNCSNKAPRGPRLRGRPLAAQFSTRLYPKQTTLPCFARAVRWAASRLGPAGQQCCLTVALARRCSATLTRISRSLRRLRGGHSCGHARPPPLNPARRCGRNSRQHLITRSPLARRLRAGLGRSAWRLVR